MSNTVAIIPARGGSKRIPRKNIKDFLGRPMISYPIQVALKSQLFDRVIVSTDDDEIARVALEQGAEVPFKRPEHLANDYAGNGAVTNHAIEWLEKNDTKPDIVCCIYATTPLLQAEYLNRGREAIENGYRLSFSCTSFPFPIQRAIKIINENRVEPFFPEDISKRSQDLEPAYHDAGQFYWGDAEAFLNGLGMFTHHAFPVVLPRYLVQDIDDEEDWKRAELLYQAIHAGD